MLTDFVGDWGISHTLGEGAYGEVKLLVNRRTGDCVAMKLIDMSCSEAAKAAVSKEVKIHKVLRNKHVIRFLGTRTQSNFQFIFLEYASNGELFDRIEPDIGMHQGEAQKFMKQLMSGVEYLHSLGITHRDIKPENLLIDQNDNLKISDFGLATIFRYNGQERLLERQCGTEPYAAPEVLARRYAAVPADLWSCGIVLVAMLAGELPWDKAAEDKLEYSAWLRGEYMSLSPWTKLDTLALSLLKRLLNPVPTLRPSLHQISAHRWLKKKFPSPISLRPLSGEVKMALEDNRNGKDGGVWLSQRERSRAGEGVEEAPTSFSQPVSNLDDILLSTQDIMATQSQGQDCLQKLVRRLTRFYVGLSREEAASCLAEALTVLRLEATLGDSIMTVRGVDKRKFPLSFKATFFQVPTEDDSPQTLIDFRLSKGDGLEFKRHYIQIRSAMSAHIVKKDSNKISV